MAIPLEASKIYLGILVPISIIVPISLVIIQYKNFPPSIKPLIFYLFSSGISNLCTKILALNGVNTMPLNHIYTVLEFFIICYFYRELLTSSKIKKYIPYLPIVFSIICILNAIYYQPLIKYNSYTKPVEAVLVIWLAITYLMELIENLDQVIDKNSGLIYINAGFLLYFSGSFVLFTIFNIFFNNTAVAIAILDVHATLLLLMYALFTIGLWKFKR